MLACTAIYRVVQSFCHSRRGERNCEASSGVRMAAALFEEKVNTVTILFIVEQ